MAGELIAGLGLFKTMFDMARGLKDINDATIRNAAVIELQEHILAAQSAQATLVERVGSLEQTVASFEKWDAEKQKYELREISPNSFAYALKDAHGGEPAHLICANCYEKRTKVILQRVDLGHIACPVCGTRLQLRSPEATRQDRAITGWRGAP
ncbi:MAG TPA: hypothetical protein VET25_03785 [Aestuariivirgaceae bacterium]|jgi:Zn finger protein HypA/HybF involved in hydrogenase expression|nr:hypothetical protein [Methyloceanibacter sp.]HYM98839.1 hypothetical protein [Aestuariivirgaceae bacterium]